MTDFVANLMMALPRRWWLFALCGLEQGAAMMLGYCACGYPAARTEMLPSR